MIAKYSRGCQQQAPTGRVVATGTRLLIATCKGYTATLGAVRLTASYIRVRLSLPLAARSRGRVEMRVLRVGGALVPLLLGLGLLLRHPAMLRLGPLYPCVRCNLIVISIDTLRADHVGCYGYPRPTTPNVDEFSRDAVVFRTTIAPAPVTLASHTSLFTSLLPSQHGANCLSGAPLLPRFVTLTEILKASGYRTASFNGGGQLAAEFGLARGFEEYWSVDPSLDVGAQTFRPVVRKAMTWLDRLTDARFFLFLHTYEVHHPYSPQPDYLRRFETAYNGSLPSSISKDLLTRINGGAIRLSPVDAQHIINTYDAEIRSMDDAFGDLIAYLKRRRLYDETVIVFTSDHGEEFGEHGAMGWHAHTLYDELLRVPLIVKLAGSRNAGTVVEPQVRTIDIAPTLLDVLGLPPNEQFTGRSLVGRIRGHADDELPAVSQQETADSVRPMSIRMRRWKLNRGELFDLLADPEERRPVKGGYEEIRRSLEAIAAQLIASRSVATSVPVEISNPTREQLRALGYVQ